MPNRGMGRSLLFYTSYMADPMASVTPIWFMVVDHNFTCTLRHPTCVDVPFNGSVYHFLREIKALGWEILSDAGGDLNVWKLRTPLPSQDVDQDCLAKLRDQEYLEKRGDGYDEEGKKKRKPEPKGKGKEEVKSEKEKQEGAFAFLLKQDDKISSHFEELTVHDSENKILILVQVPAKAGGTSFRAVSTRCQLIQLRMYSKHKLQLLIIYSTNLSYQLHRMTPNTLSSDGVWPTIPMPPGWKKFTQRFGTKKNLSQNFSERSTSLKRIILSCKSA